MMNVEIRPEWRLLEMSLEEGIAWEDWLEKQQEQADAEEAARSAAFEEWLLAKVDG